MFQLLPLRWKHWSTFSTFEIHHQFIIHILFCFSCWIRLRLLQWQALADAYWREGWLVFSSNGCARHFPFGDTGPPLARGTCSLNSLFNDKVNALHIVTFICTVMHFWSADWRQPPPVTTGWHHLQARGDPLGWLPAHHSLSWEMWWKLSPFPFTHICKGIPPPTPTPTPKSKLLNWRKWGNRRNWIHTGAGTVMDLSPRTISVPCPRLPWGIWTNH